MCPPTTGDDQSHTFFTAASVSSRCSVLAARQLRDQPILDRRPLVVRDGAVGPRIVQLSITWQNGRDPRNDAGDDHGVISADR